ncbi:MAG: nitroreductase family protein [Lachnospiraceae bacterium]|nr:nitroreductase family protein [Lachnospiraceae bacterium]
MAGFKEVSAKRSSTRAYTAEKLTKEELDSILAAGLQAPSATNRQEIRFSVLDGSDPVIEELEQEKMRLRNAARGEHNAFYEAPTVIFLSAEDDFRWSKVDAGIAVQSMSLAAEDLGLGSLIVGSVYDAMRGEKREYFKEKMRIPADREFQIALAVGHKAAEKEPHTYDTDKQVVIV